MKKIDKETLKVAANNLMFDMDDAEFDSFLEEFHVISKQLELFNDIPEIDDVELMFFPFKVNTTFLREDKCSKPLTRDDALKNAGDVENDQIRLPKVVD